MNLDLSNNTALEKLNCSDNQLTNLDLSNNLNLNWLMCRENQLTNLNLSNNTALQELYCQDNQLTNLDLSNCSALRVVFCYDNQLTGLNLANGNNVNTGNNLNLQVIWAENNNLTCVQVDDVTYSNTNWIPEAVKFDTGVTFSEDCEALGIDDLYANNNEISVYPNPTNDLIYLNKECQVKIYNIQGTLLKETFGKEVDLSGYSQGMYFLRIGGRIEKIVKQ